MRKAAPFIAAISVIVWGGAAASLAASSLPRLLRMDVSSNFAVRPATMSFGCCAQFVIGGPGVSSTAFRSGRLGHIRWMHWGSARSAGIGLLWIDNCIPSCASGTFRPRPVSIQASRVENGRYTRLLLIYRSGNRQVFDRRKLERLPGMKGPAYQWFAIASAAPKTHGGRAPSVSTGAAGSITRSAAAVSGTVNPNGRSTTYYFQYGTTTSYGPTTASQAAGSGTTAVNVSANLSGLTAGTTYHYRVHASNASGTAYGSDRTFTTLMSAQQSNANRAVATYNATQQRFYAAYVYPGDTSSLYTENYPQNGKRYSYLWPFSRAVAGTITLSGIPSVVVGGASYQADVTERLTGLWSAT
jgi:hypothetical protein